MDAHRNDHKESAHDASQLFVRLGGGAGPAVLFLHGLTGSGAMWEPVLDHLPSLSAVVPDLIGFGRSPKPDVAYDLTTQLDALAPLVERYRPTAVAAHSMGAVVALGMLHRWPSIGLAMLVSPAVFRSPDEAREAMRTAPLLHRVSLRSKVAARVLCEVVCALRPVLRPLAPLFAKDLPPEVARASLDHTWTSYSRSMDRLVTSGLVPGLLRGIGERVVVLHGDRDGTVPVGHICSLRSQVRQLTIVEGDHLLVLRQAAVVARFVSQTVRSTSPSRLGGVSV